MHPLVQSAIDAANQGDNNKALELCKQALAANPNDVDAWLVVAAVVDQPERKRMCLERVLALDPGNQIARDELLDMDRAAMGGTALPVSEPAYSSSAPAAEYPISTSAFESEPAPHESAFESAPAPEQSAPIMPSLPTASAIKTPSKARAEKPLVFQYPLFWRISMYFSVVFFACIALLAALENILYGLAFFGMAIVAGAVTMIYLAKVEVSAAGIRTSNVFTHSEVRWKDIKSIKSSGMKQALELVKNNGQVIKVSNQVSGYSRIVEILRQRRPDLFGMAASSMQGNAPSESVQTPAFSGAKKFEKSFFRQYGIFFLVTPFCLFAAWTAVMDPKNRLVASAMFVIFTGLLIFSLFQVNAVKVEPDKLTLETLFEQKVFSARQIREIKMQSVRGRYGIVTHFVIIVSMEGKKYSVSGFSVGEDVMYGFLMNWWNAYRSR